MEGVRLDIGERIMWRRGVRGRVNRIGAVKGGETPLLWGRGGDGVVLAVFTTRYDFTVRWLERTKEGSGKRWNRHGH